VTLPRRIDGRIHFYKKYPGNSFIGKFAWPRCQWDFLCTLEFFWEQIIQNKDYRFVFEAIGVHFLWLISAVIVAMPFWTTWRAWRLERVRALGELVNQDAPEAKLSALRELRPAGSWNFATVLAAVLSAMVTPLIQLASKLVGAG
jgi:hypothetical protein